MQDVLATLDCFKKRLRIEHANANGYTVVNLTCNGRCPDYDFCLSIAGLWENRINLRKVRPSQFLGSNLAKVGRYGR